MTPSANPKIALNIYYGILLTILLPLWLIYSLGTGEYTNQVEYFTNLLCLSLWIIFFFLSMPWGFVSYYIRYGIIALFGFVAFLIYLTNILFLPFSTNPLFSSNIEQILILFLTLVAIILITQVIKGYTYPDEAIELTFPLQYGTYYVHQGGSSKLINHHLVNQAQSYGLDILKLNNYGLRAKGIYPQDLTLYQIFAESLYSPCDGIVVSVVDNLPDLVPPNRDQTNPAGNHIVIKKQGIKVVLAHLHQGSVLVKVGESIVEGQPLAKIGNSGNTTEPHLHIHAERVELEEELKQGIGIPILFEGKFLRRNSLLRK